MQADRPPLSIGRSGRLAAYGLSGPDGNSAVLVRQEDQARALVTGERGEGGRERLIVIPLDDDVEVRVDGDALAVWLGSAPVTASGVRRDEVPAWASLIGLVLVLAVVGFAILGSVTFFGWLFSTLGQI